MTYLKNIKYLMTYLKTKIYNSDGCINFLNYFVYQL